MCTIFLIGIHFKSKLQKFEMSEKGKTCTTSRMNLTAAVIPQINFKLYRMLIKKIQIPEMIMVAQKQILIPLSRKAVFIILFRQQNHCFPLYPSAGTYLTRNV